MNKPWACLSRHWASRRAAKRWFWKHLVLPRGNTDQKEGIPVPRKNLPDARPTHSHTLHIITGKKRQHCMLYMLLLWHAECRNDVGISAASVLITAKLHPQRGGETERQEGASPGRRGHSLPIQLDSTVGTSLCCTSKRSLASCSEINHDFETPSNNSFNKLPLSHTSFQLQYKIWPWLRQNGKEII